MDISIIIVNWNTKKLLLECIQSIEQETADYRHEVIVVDNASTDGSVEAVTKQFPGVKVTCNSSNQGFAVANNIGIRASSGKYVCLINSDVKVLSRCLDRMTGYMEEHPDVGALGPQILDRDLHVQPSCTELPSLGNTLAQALALEKLLPGLPAFRTRFMRNFDHASLRRVPVLSGCFLMVRQKALAEVGGLDERFYIYKEDVDWCKRFCDAGWEVVFYPDAKAIHYGGASSASAPTRFLIEMERANRQYWKKHYAWSTEKAAQLIGFAHYALRLCGWAIAYLLKGGQSVEARDMVRKYTVCLLWMGGLSPDFRDKR